jgi:hypothetical protein
MDFLSRNFLLDLTFFNTSTLLRQSVFPLMSNHSKHVSFEEPKHSLIKAPILPLQKFTNISGELYNEKTLEGLRRKDVQITKKFFY